MNSEQFYQWCAAAPTADSSVYLRKPLVMGILNVTPDSFSDGALFGDTERACQRAEQMVAEGADIIDVGGESSNPGALPVSLDEELERVIPVIERLHAVSDVCISIDTYKPSVMQAAVAAGASFINDIKALREPNALTVAASLKVPVCLMHMQGNPQSMQDNPHYDHDVVDEVNSFFKERVAACLGAKIAREHLVLDPGFGFGKSVTHNLTLLNRLGEFHSHHCPILLGVSRKSTIGAVLQKEVVHRMTGGLAIAAFAALQGVTLIRTHDVDETSQVLRMIEAIVTIQMER